MKSDRDLSRLFQYASKTEWSGCLEEALHDHFQPAMVEFDVEHAEIVELLGEHWALSLWSCAFEDLLARQFKPDGANLADDYLKRRGWRETPGAKNYIRALRTAVMSLYEVSDVIPGRSFLARDLIRGGEPVLVSEKGDADAQGLGSDRCSYPHPRRKAHPRQRGFALHHGGGRQADRGPAQGRG